jgi:hypothetical protein
LKMNAALFFISSSSSGSFFKMMLYRPPSCWRVDHVLFRQGFGMQLLYIKLFHTQESQARFRRRYSISICLLSQPLDCFDWTSINRSRKEMFFRLKKIEQF